MTVKKQGDFAIKRENLYGTTNEPTYAGATSLEEFHRLAVVGVQSHTGYEEGRPLNTSW